MSTVCRLACVRDVLRRCVLVCTLACVAALILAGCGAQTSALPVSHTFKGTLSVTPIGAPYSLPGTIVATADGSIWFPAIAYQNFGTDQPSGAIGRISPAGALAFFPLPEGNTYPWQLTVGPDGSLWFTAFHGEGSVQNGVDTPPRFAQVSGEIGHMSPSGTFQPFVQLATSALPDGITSGPDGNIWFTENTVAPTNGTAVKVARLSPTGTLTEYPVSGFTTSGDAARYISTGPDGNVWFTIQTSAGYSAVCRVGRITPQGTVTIYSPPNLFIAGDITSGPDNGIWLASGFNIARAGTDGKISEYPLPKEGFGQAFVGGITAGGDGALWFATDASSVGRIAPDGTIKLYPLPQSLYFDNGGSSEEINELKGITTAPDGTLWLTDDHQIGHFV